MLFIVVVIVSWFTAVLLSSSALAQGIYTCVDAKGRRITSDRKIVECTDRIQHQVSPSGMVVRVLGPTLTEREFAAQEEKDKLQADGRLREQEGKRRNRTLLTRYPNQAAHDKERALALVQVDDLIGAALPGSKEQETQRVVINAEFEYYKKNPSKAPPALVRRRDENDRKIAEQKGEIAEQTIEKQRLNARFDEELLKLKQLWATANVPPPSASASSSKSAATN